MMTGKEMTAKGSETAVEIYERDNYEKDRVLVIYLPDVHEEHSRNHSRPYQGEIQ